jgi:sulfur-carrier protein
MIRVVLPIQLRRLARVNGEVLLNVQGQPTLGSVLDALEAGYPMLQGTVRDHVTRQRRPMVRFYACGEDLSHQPVDTPLPEAIAAGDEPFLIGGPWPAARLVGAVAGDPDAQSHSAQVKLRGPKGI